MYSWLHLSPEWCSGAFPGSIPACQACRDLLVGSNTVITVRQNPTWGSTEYTLCFCGTYLLPWGHRDPPDTVGIGGVAIWKARGWEITCWVLQGLSTSCGRGEKKAMKKEWLWKTPGSTKVSAHGCCVQAGGCYSQHCSFMVLPKGHRLPEALPKRWYEICQNFWDRRWSVQGHRWNNY